MRNVHPPPIQELSGLHYGSYWSEDYNQQCYSGSHRTLALALGIPGLLLIAAGWPLVMGVLASVCARRPPPAGGGEGAGGSPPLYWLVRSYFMEFKTRWVELEQYGT